MALPSPSSSRATASSEKEEKFQNADFSASMPSIISRPLAWGEKDAVLKAVLTPLQLAVAAAEPQRDAIAFGVLLQNAQIELHYVPADQHVGVVFGKPGVELFQQQGTAGGEDQLEVDVWRRFPVRGPACRPPAGRSLPDRCSTARRGGWFRYPATPISAADDSQGSASCAR
ncbi:Uncharacterised protein [Klebsiella pneumoniae]|uniref:Uncharacterized protein n=1 Tax=Klebsiella pneumoniae TaxID=573 RepID=A0A378CHE8_KLEPN|nr:Uncharacterised protein [Klebsiella pneumoniae]